MRKLIFTTYLFLICSYSYGQIKLDDFKSSKHTYLTTRFHGGLVIPHHVNMMYFLDDFSSGIEINYGRSNFSEDSWEGFFNYPELGVGFYYGTFGNKDIYGAGLALFPYINYNIYRNSKLSIQNKVALGLGYATKPFDIETNTYNTVFSSHLNAYIGLALLMDYRVSKHFSVALSGSLTHLSNGAASKPNHGINTLTASLGAKYHFNEALTPDIERTKPPKSREREVIIIGSAGRSQSTYYNQNLYWNASLSINHLWHLNAKRAVGIGYDQFYSQVAPYVWTSKDEYAEILDYSTKDYIFNGLFASYNVFLGNTTLFANIGIYLHTNIKPPQPIYPRLGVRQTFAKNFIANFSVKASFFRSEFLEFGLGYRIPYSHNKKQ